MVIGFLMIALIVVWFWVMLVQPVMQAQHNREMQAQQQRWEESQEKKRLQQTLEQQKFKQHEELPLTEAENQKFMKLILDFLFMQKGSAVTFEQIYNNIPALSNLGHDKAQSLKESLKKSESVLKFNEKGKILFKLKREYLNMSHTERVDDLQDDILTAIWSLADEADLQDIVAEVMRRRYDLPSEYSSYIAEAIECLEKIGILKVRGDKDNPYYSCNEEFEIPEEYDEYPPYSELVKQANVQKSFSGIFAVDKMEGHQFEYYCANLLRKLNFSNVEVTKGSGDQGVDIIAVKENIRYAIQCKCYSSPLGNSPVQEVNAGKQMYHCHVAVVLTNQYFTSGAKKLAEATGVLLWDRDELVKMIQKVQEANK